MHGKTADELYRKQAVQLQWGTCLSYPFTVTNGVKQAGFQVHIYFMFTLTNLSTAGKSTQDSTYCGRYGCESFPFADDLCVFFVPAAVAFSTLWIVVAIMLLEMKLFFNCNKTVSAGFSLERLKHPTTPLVSLNGGSVKFVEQVKYVGVLHHPSMKVGNDNQTQAKSLCRAAEKLRSTFAQCSTSVKTTLASCLLHANVCLPIVSLVWNTFALPETIPNEICITCQGTEVFAYIKLPVTSGHLMPWLETIWTFLWNDERLQISLFLLFLIRPLQSPNAVYKSPYIFTLFNCFFMFDDDRMQQFLVLRVSLRSSSVWTTCTNYLLPCDALHTIISIPLCSFN